MFFGLQACLSRPRHCTSVTRHTKSTQDGPTLHKRTFAETAHTKVAGQPARSNEKSEPLVAANAALIALLNRTIPRAARCWCPLVAPAEGHASAGPGTTRVMGLRTLALDTRSTGRAISQILLEEAHKTGLRCTREPLEKLYTQKLQANQRVRTKSRSPHCAANPGDSPSRERSVISLYHDHSPPLVGRTSSTCRRAHLRVGKDYSGQAPEPRFTNVATAAPHDRFREACS